MLSVALKEFRSETGGSALALSPKDLKWCCADGLGSINTLNNASEEWSDAQVVEGVVITALSINNSSTQCALAYDKTVHIYEYPSFENVVSASVFRAEMDISKIEYDSSGQYIFIASYSRDIAIYSVASGSIETTIPTNYTGVVSMSLKEVDNSLYIAIVTTSGEVVIYHMNVERGPKGQTYTNATKQHSALSIINRENCIQEKNINCGISWAPGPSLTLAVPAFSGSLCLLRKHDPSSTTWIEEMVVSADVTLGHGSLDLTMVCYSPNGKYLLSSDMKGFVACWRCDERASNYEILRKWHTTPLNNKHLDDIRWGLEVESNYMLLLAGSHYARVKDVVNMKVGHASPTAMTANEPVAAAGISDANESLSNGVAPASGKSLKRSKKPPLGVDNDDEDIEFDTTNVRGPVLEENLRKKSILDDEALDALADDKENGLVIDDDMESEDDEAQGPYLPNGGMNIEYQPPIQLACTTYDEQGRRYLTWNHIGSIVSRQDTIISGGTSSNRIEIRFSDAMSANRQEVITDHYGYSMAALSQDGAIFAAAPDDAADDDEDDHANGMTSALNKFLANKNLPGSVVYYHAFPNSMKLTGNPGATYNDTFQFTLSHKEAVTAVACGSGWVAFSTNKNYLRVLTTTGIQLSIIRLKGDVVSMVGEGSKLAIAYHRGVPMHDTPNLAVDIYSISNYDSAAATSTTAANGASVGISSMIYQQDVVLPLTKGSTLSWMGFDVTEGSENNNPSNHMNMLVVMDSSDVISTLVHTSRITTHPTNGTAIPNTNARVNDFAWVPVLDVNQVKKSFDHHYWPIAVKGFRLLYVLLHGESKPAIHPQPIVTTQAYKLPIIELRSDSTSKKDKEKEAINESVRSVMLDHMKYVNMEYCKYDIEDSILLSTNTSGAASENALSLLDAAEAKCVAYQLDSDKAVLKCFQRACQQSKLHLAVDYIMRYIRSPKSLSAAITIANHHGRTKIARLIDDYAKNLAALDEETTVVESSSELSYVPQSNINDQAHLRSPTSTDHSNSQPISEEKSLKSVLKSDNFSTVVTPDMDFDSSAVKKANSKVKFDVESNGSNFVSAPGSPVRDNLMEGDDEIRINSNLKKLKKKLPPNPFSITNSNNLSTSSPLRQQVDEMNKYNKNSKRKNIGNGSTNLFDDIKHNLTASPSPVKKSRYLS